MRKAGIVAFDFRRTTSAIIFLMMQNQKTESELIDGAKKVLEENHRGTHTVPAPDLYPHQWLWDSCFIAIGLRHYDIDKAKTEILSLFNGQWANGMMPNIILAGRGHSRHHDIWRSWTNPNAPSNVHTSGITQPPVVAEAVVKIGEKMKLPERRTWYKTVFPGLLAYHQWIYKERDPHEEGLALLVHPWETGLDNTTPWMSALHEHQLATWIRVVDKLNLGSIINLFRSDTKQVPAEERMNIIDVLALFSTHRRMRRKNYDIHKILAHSLFTIEDVNFNAMLIRNNHHLRSIAKSIRHDIPHELDKSMQKTEKAFEKLWDPYTSQYYSREFVSHRLLKYPSIGTLLALYAGHIDKDRAHQLVKLLEDENQFGANFPVPSVPLSDEQFKPFNYWQGPSWVNTNWLIIQGLNNYGFHDHADALKESTIEMVGRSGFNEYFNPINGDPAGVGQFSWTAALTIDLIES